MLKGPAQKRAGPLNFLEAASGFEPLCKGFAVRKSTFYRVLATVTESAGVKR